MRHAWQFVGLTLALALPAAAQQPGRPRMHMQNERPVGPGAVGWRAGEMPFAPEYLLARNGELELTPQQITRLTGIRNSARHSAGAAMEQSRHHMDALQKALEANTPDTATVRTEFLAAQDGMGQARLAAVLASAQSKALLTDAQRSQVNAWQDHRSTRPWDRGRQPGPEGAPRDHPPGR
jgi:Spy/CpxP family protein refolding chaperone